MASDKQTLKTLAAIKTLQEACRELPCTRIQQGMIGCAFCPHYAKPPYANNLPE